MGLEPCGFTTSPGSYPKAGMHNIRPAKPKMMFIWLFYWFVHPRPKAILVRAKKCQFNRKKFLKESQLSIQDKYGRTLVNAALRSGKLNDRKGRSSS
jgi:hypothetical protein